MGPNAFQSLHALPGVFSAVPVTNLTSVNDFQSYIDSIDAERQRVLTGGIDMEEDFKHLGTLVKVSVPEYFVDCAAVIAVSSALQCALSHRLQSTCEARGYRPGALPQEETHLLVDLWGQVEASRALFEFVLRQSEQAISAAGKRSLKSESLCAQFRVLQGGVERLILEIGAAYGQRLTMSEVAVAIDWCLSRVRDVGYVSIGQAIDQELAGLSV